MARLSDAERAEYERGRTADYVIQPVRLEGKIRLDDYNPAWPGLFEREAARIRGVLGDRVRRLEHVGSTSVPGLAAKPIIDILLVVASPADEDAYVAPLEQARYRLKVREPDWHDHRLLKGPDTDINLHVHRPGSPEVGRMARFRDHLRADPADRARYERAKRDLAARDWTYTQQYADAKSDVVEEILLRS